MALGRFGASGVNFRVTAAMVPNVHSADGWEDLLLPEIERQQAQGKEVAFRGDAAFAKPESYESIEEREAKYAIRLPANANLE
ncbi:MAG: transposase, partial [Deltaproteobacteria bacterium]|nr:transposase [Deltaproteobacteria bacterium]